MELAMDENDNEFGSESSGINTDDFAKATNNR